jgi:7-cyano-7-deazaguanine synthase
MMPHSRLALKIREITMTALVILSGGQDSTTCLFLAINEHGRENVRALTFDYGQRHLCEVQAAMTIAQMAEVEWEQIYLANSILKGNSPLTNPDAELEIYRDYDEMDKIIGSRIEKTFVPMRNALFLTIAANRAVIHGCDEIVTGVCQQDNANYPDCRAEFISSMQITINLALGIEPGINIWAPLMDFSKAESIKIAKQLPGCWQALAFSHTAYDGKYPPTSHDHASVLRARGFEEAGEPDPLVVRAVREGLMPLPDTANYDGLRDAM